MILATPREQHNLFPPVTNADNDASKSPQFLAFWSVIFFQTKFNRKKSFLNSVKSSN